MRQYNSENAARIGLLFPGQGAQVIGMGKSFYDSHASVREIFEQASDILNTNLSHTIFNGPESQLTETKTAQPALFVTCYAVLEALKRHYNLPKPSCTSGLSLGEYTALAAAGAMSFEQALSLVNLRGKLMHNACESHKGTMLVVMGLTDKEVLSLVMEFGQPQILCCANFNCPGQVVVSGTHQAIEAFQIIAKDRGAKRTIPLNVHGAFHSPLMADAQKELSEALNETVIVAPFCPVALNVTGHFVDDADQIRSLLLSQVTSSVLWHQCVKTCESHEISCFLEVGCGKTLAGLNKRIGVNVPTIPVETIDDIRSLEPFL